MMNVRDQRSLCVQTRSFSVQTSKGTTHIIGDIHHPLYIAGPCSVESYEQLSELIPYFKQSKTRFLRGGTFKARTYQDSFQGLGKEGLEILVRVAQEHDMFSVSEITSELDLELYEQVDIIQVGTRNAQNYRLLAALGEFGKPVILKRGMGETIEEFIASTSYISSQGNERIILCERGIRTFEQSLRSTLDLGAIPVIQERCPYPILVDPSHASGLVRFVEPLALGAQAVGANGIMVEVHPRPTEALSDAKQQLSGKEYVHLVEKMTAMLSALVGTSPHA